MFISQYTARRHAHQAIQGPEYEFQHVPKAKVETEESIVLKVHDRDVWTKNLGELVLLCNHAEMEHEKKLKATGGFSIHSGKPLGLEYIIDRIDTDDPFNGYMVRSKNEGWLQGFISYTTFTTWQRWFRWDTFSEAADVLNYDYNYDSDDDLVPNGDHHSSSSSEESEESGEREKRKKSSLNESAKLATNRKRKKLSAENSDFQRNIEKWWADRLIDGDNRLARALEAQLREGDPDDEGVIWPHVAEISLLGAYGCGGYLLNLVIEELESSESPYEYVILQAAENSVEFYEKYGFVRVGAIARYANKATNTTTSTTSTSSMMKDDDGDEDDHIGVSGGVGSGGNIPKPVIFEEASSSSSFSIHKTKTSSETPISIAESYGVNVDDILFLNRRQMNITRKDSPFPIGTHIRVPKIYLEKEVDPLIKTTREARIMTMNDAKQGGISSNGLWYTCLERETPYRIANKLNVPVQDLVDENKKRYPGMLQYSALMAGTVLRIPNTRLDTLLLGPDAIPCPKEPSTSSTSWALNSEPPEPNLTDVMAYRHWTFSDDPVATSAPSYMMARPLKKNKNQTTKFRSFVNVDETLVSKPPLTYNELLLGRSWMSGEIIKRRGKVMEEEANNNKNKNDDDDDDMDMIYIPEGYRMARMSIRCNGMKDAFYGPFQLHYYEPQQQSGETTYQIRKRNHKQSTSTKLESILNGREQCNVRFRLKSGLQGPLPIMISKTVFPPARPKKPIRPLTAIQIFRNLHRPQVSGMGVKKLKDQNRILDAEWDKLTPAEQDSLEEEARKKRDEYLVLLAEYRSAIRKYERLTGIHDSPAIRKKKLFNRVVSILPSKTEGRKKQWCELHHIPYEDQSKVFKYWFVFNYIPDLNWCTLIPLQQVGVFETCSRHPRAIGKPMWKTIGDGYEIDISASRVSVVRSITCKNSTDVDKEQWMIYDDDDDLDLDLEEEDDDDDEIEDEDFNKKTKRLNVKATFKPKIQNDTSVLLIEEPPSTKMQQVQVQQQSFTPKVYNA